jgi:hypothetical protein
MWGTTNDLEEDLKETGRETGSEKVNIGFWSKDGVVADSEKVINGVEYAKRGSGVVKARGFDGKSFSS